MTTSPKHPIRKPHRETKISAMLMAAFLAVVSTAPATANDGVPAPATQATLFAPGTVSTSDYEFSFLPSPDGRTAYVTRLEANSIRPAIYELKWENGAWSTPTVMPFSGNNTDINPAFSPDSNHLVFSRTAARSRENRFPKTSLWTVERMGATWGSPKKLSPEIETDSGEMSLAWAGDGTLYFASPRNAHRDSDLYRTSPTDGVFAKPVALFDGINTRYDELSLCVARNGRFLIFSSRGRPDSHGEADLYISFKKGEAWTAGQHIGPAVNSAGDEINPRLSPDDQQLYFSRNGDIYEIPVSALTQPDERSVRAWQPRAEAPTGRVWARAVTLNEKIYVLGDLSGWGEGQGPLATMDEYDPATNQWKTKAPLPNPEPMAPAVVVDGKLLLFQREKGAFAFEYDPEHDTWTPRSGNECQYQRGPDMMAVASNHKLYVTRSVYSPYVQWISDMMEYDPLSGQSRPLGSLRYSYSHGTVVAGSDGIYAIGSGSLCKGTLRYDLARHEWRSLPDMPTGRVEVRSAEWNGQIIAVGGHGVVGAALANVEAYNPTLNAWTILPDLPETCWGAAVVVCSGRLFVIGGSVHAHGANPAARTVWEYMPDESR